MVVISSAEPLAIKVSLTKPSQARSRQSKGKGTMEGKTEERKDQRKKESVAVPVASSYSSIVDHMLLAALVVI